MTSAAANKSQPHVMLRAALYLRVSTARQAECPALMTGGERYREPVSA